jgi:hypothetical protein
MEFYPSKTQWLKWSLISKIVYIAFILTIISPALWGISFMTGCAKENQEKLISGQEEIKNNEGTRITEQEEIKGILKRMQNINRDKGDELLIKYPLGYYLFAIDHNKVIIPYKSQLSTKYTINWERSRIVEFGLNKIILQFPDMYHNNVRFAYNDFIVLNKKVGSSIKAIRLNNMRSIFEILANDDNGLVVVLGFIEVT